MRLVNRLLAVGTLGLGLVGCEAPKAPPPRTAVTVPIADTTTPKPPDPPPRLREGIRLDGLENAKLHAIDGALIVSSRSDTKEGSITKLYVARGDSLENDPKLAFGPGNAIDEITLAGHLPDTLFALIEDNTGKKTLLRHGPTWVEQTMPEKLRTIVSFANGVYGFITDPRLDGTNELSRLDQKAPALPLPKGEGPACDAFYTKGRGLFPKLAVQPRGVNAAFGSLFVFGMGCDSQVAAAAFSSPDPNTLPALFSIPAPMFFDGFPGKVAGNNAADFWYFRRPMRPMALATLFHFDGKSMTETPFVTAKGPLEDPQAEDIAVDASGAVWIVIDNKLFVKRGGRPFQEHPLPQSCEARDLAQTTNSLWVRCQTSVARVSTTKSDDP